MVISKKISESISLEFFADADYANRATDRRSVSGGAIMYAGACVCCSSRTQKCATLFTCEAEYVALGDAVKEFLFLRQVYHFILSGEGMSCFPVFDDSQGDVKLSQNLHVYPFRRYTDALIRGIEPVHAEYRYMMPLVEHFILAKHRDFLVYHAMMPQRETLLSVTSVTHNTRYVAQSEELSEGEFRSSTSSQHLY